MYLLIDLSKNDLIHLSLFDKDSLIDFDCSGRNRELLGCIEKFLKENKIENHEIDGIMSVVGDGSFTNTRISAVVANVFGYALKIPIMAIRKEQISDIQKLIPELENVFPGQYISAKYSAEPNIG